MQSSVQNKCSHSFDGENGLSFFILFSLTLVFNVVLVMGIYSVN